MPSPERIVVVPLDDLARVVHDGTDAAQMIPDKVVYARRLNRPLVGHRLHEGESTAAISIYQRTQVLEPAGFGFLRELPAVRAVGELSLGRSDGSLYRLHQI